MYDTEFRNRLALDVQLDRVIINRGHDQAVRITISIISSSGTLVVPFNHPDSRLDLVCSIEPFVTEILAKGLRTPVTSSA